MKKLFISQPMKDKTDEEILAVRAKAIESAERELGEPVEVIDSFFSRTRHMTRVRFGIWLSHWNCCQRLMWRILRKTGNSIAVAVSRTSALLHTVLM